MRRASSRVLAASVGTALALVGCSSGGGSSNERGDTPRDVDATTTTTAPARIDLSQPIPGGSLHGTPRPPLENTGDDYVAIFESIDARFRWLSENPDVPALSDLYVPGTTTHDFQASVFDELVRNGWRAADEGYQLVSVEVVDARSDAVSLRVIDSMQREVIVDEGGMQVGDGRPRSPATKAWSVLLTPDTGGAWRVASWSPAEGGVVEI